nr:immunoglobulin light chain junction region [Macaca mulatta]MOW06673.1 immunoglobulin light chain junction region [Macaca mulatta]
DYYWAIWHSSASAFF